jgi:DNA-binding MarR family transcriptional regulator
VGGIVHLIHRLGQQADDLFSRSVGRNGITARQFSVLASVAGNDHPSQTVLCAATGIDRSTMADIVRRLVKRGWLTRRRTRHDARTYAISLTVEGQRILDQVLPIATTVDATLISDLAVEEQQQFTSLLQNIVGHHKALSSNDDDHPRESEPPAPLMGVV